MTTKPKLIILCALNCEAKSLIDFYRMKKTAAKPFNHYISESDSEIIELVISGIGYLPMSMAVGWVAGQNIGDQLAWLNVGTAGHGERSIGEIVRVHCCADSASFNAEFTRSRDSHYPPLTAGWPGSTDAVVSFSEPCTQYPAGVMVDMEAHAFFKSALKCSTSELVQSIKVISDNRDDGIESLNADRITQLMQPHTSIITSFVSELLSLLPIPQMPFAGFEYLRKIRTTHSQHHQLSELVIKAKALGFSGGGLQHSLTHLSSAKEVIDYLRALISSTAPVLE